MKKVKDNPTIAYLRDVLGIELEQIDNELKKTKVDIGFFVEPVSENG